MTSEQATLPLARAVEAHLRQQLASTGAPQDRDTLQAALDELPRVLEAGMRIKRMSHEELEREYALVCAQVVKLTAYLRRIDAIMADARQWSERVATLRPTEQ